jgi:hypothetical protein
MSHYFESDLPLPVARKLQIEKLAPPEKVRATRAEIAALLRQHLGPFRLTEEERARLEIPVVDDWYRFGRSTKLHQFEHVVRSTEDADQITRVTPEILDEVGGCCHSMFSTRHLGEMLGRSRDAALLTIDILLAHGLRRITEAVQKELGRLSDPRPMELARRWEEITQLRCAPAPGPAPAAPPETAPEGLPRDLLAVSRDIRRAALRDLSEQVIHITCELKIPDLLPWGFEKDEARERKEAEVQRLRELTEPHGGPMARACIDRLLPAEPWLVERSGVTPAALLHLLSWRHEFDQIAALQAQVYQDVEDLDRLNWLHGRHLIRTLMNDFASAIITGTHEKTHWLLFQLSFALSQSRGSPPPKLVRQWIREKHRKMERVWRARLLGI